MAFIDMDLENVVQPEPVPDGEYTVQIEAADEVPSKGNPEQINIRLRCSVVGEPNAEAIFHYIPGFGPEDDETRKNNKKRMAVGVLRAFEIDYESGFDPEDLVGATAELLLTQEEYEGRVSNKLVIPW